MEESIKSLKNYIEANLKNEDDGSWEYVHRPIIRDIISNLNQTDSELLSVDILNWDEETQFFLVDEITDSKNEYLDKSFLYCSILLKTNNHENGEYLLENFLSMFNALDSSKCSIDFLEKLRAKVIEFSKAEINESHIFHKQYIEKLKNVFRE
ncbi:hypothetical protein ACI6PS_00435 [Flavobacterium sp. PLA-1-15]|uniref:hypothetical protein n=1 Tax=Flavobacterium sp. PLA-1-15 TaxID=3380533 RepID=UPI003B82A5F2